MAQKSSNAALQRSKWLGLNPSQLRHQVQIQSGNTTQDASGGQSSTGWVTVRSAWASINAAGQKEDYQSGQFSGQVTDIITVRYAAAPPVLPGMRALFLEQNGTLHTYLIQTVDNVEKRNIVMRLMCLEIDGGQ